MIEMKNNTHSSIWSSSCGLPEFPDLKKDIKTGVLIIGGGIAGILCGFMLEQAGVDYILLEADRICSGITKNTTAKITSQHGLIYDKLLKRLGRNGRFYILKQIKGLWKNIESLVKELTVILKKRMPLSIRWTGRKFWKRN